MSDNSLYVASNGQLCKLVGNDPIEEVFEMEFIGTKERFYVPYNGKPEKYSIVFEIRGIRVAG